MTKSDIYLPFQQNNKYNRNNSHSFKTSPGGGFTIVELLVVIVVIGILAAISLIAYTGISSRAIATSLQSDLTNASQQLKLYSQIYSSYPTALNASNCPTAPIVDNTYCLKASSGNTLTYTLNTATNPQTFSLTATNTNNTNYRITNTSSPLACPLNFIIVPGSPAYGTSDFCVMKYEARQVGATNTPISQATGLPWVSISQTNAIAYSPNVVGCTGCHLMSEAEWMTLAQNVLSVPSNWSGGVVGSGYIYSGHNDNAPANAIAATTDDTDSYNGTGNVAPSNQRRTLTLTNGEIIWDLAGNVYEWTTATIGANAQPGLTGEVAYAWKEWNNGSLLMNGLPALSQPSSVGIAGAGSWSSAQGIGQLYSNYGETVVRAFRHSGFWNNGNIAGIFYLNLVGSASTTDVAGGFRVAK